MWFWFDWWYFADADAQDRADFWELVAQFKLVHGR